MVVAFRRVGLPAKEAVFYCVARGDVEFGPLATHWCQLTEFEGRRGSEEERRGDKRMRSGEAM